MSTATESRVLSSVLFPLPCTILLPSNIRVQTSLVPRTVNSPWQYAVDVDVVGGPGDSQGLGQGDERPLGGTVRCLGAISVET